MTNLKLLIAASVVVPFSTLVFTGCKSTGSHDEHTGHSHSSSAAKPYPLKNCIVTDEALGGHGDVIAFNYQGQEIKLCCEGCREDFDKEPAKYLAKLKAR